MNERFWYLKCSQILSGLSAEDLRQLETRSRSKWFPKNSPVYLPSDPASGLLLLAEGRVRISSTSPDGKKAVIAYIEAGELFGELALLGAPRREDLAEAMLRSLIIWMPRDEFLSIMHQNLQVALGITKLVGLRRQRVERRLRSLLFRSVRQRLASLLLELVERYGTKEPLGTRISLKLSHQELASAIGSTHESVTLTLGELQQEGLIERRGNFSIVASVQSLAEEAESAERPLERQKSVYTENKG